MNKYIYNNGKKISKKQEKKSAFWKHIKKQLYLAERVAEWFRWNKNILYSYSIQAMTYNLTYITTCHRSFFYTRPTLYYKEE